VTVSADILRKRGEYDADQAYFDLLLEWQLTGRWRPRVEGILREIRRHLPRQARVLDVGCAIGTFAVELARRTDAGVVALDFSVTALRTAQQLAREARLADRVAFLAGAAEVTGLRSASFDLVIAADVIEHLVDPDAFLREVVRLLRPGGVLVLESPNTLFRQFPAYPRLRRLADRLGLQDSRFICKIPDGLDYGHYHIALRSYPELLEMLRGAGFVVVSHRPFGWWLELRGLDRITRAACRAVRPFWPAASYYADTDVLLVARRPSSAPRRGSWRRWKRNAG